MPTYVYECQECSTKIEADQRITEAPLTDCHCGAKGSLQRLIQPTMVMFRGSGFHINDYAPGQSKSECTGEPSACPACSPIEDKG